MQCTRCWGDSQALPLCLDAKALCEKYRRRISAQSSNELSPFRPFGKVGYRRGQPGIYGGGFVKTGLIVERDVQVEMRDGVSLATDIYRPDDNERHGVLVHRTPYSKSNAWFVGGLILNPVDAAQHGYVVLIQDTRGRFLSEGEWDPFVNEGADGYDTIEWAAEQQWSTGNVGIYGSSYMGVTTLQALVASPPHLKAVLSYLTGANYQNGWTYSGGAFELGFNLWWTNFLGWDSAARLKLSDDDRAGLLGELAEMAADPWSAARQLPLIEMPAFDDGVAEYWRTWLEHPTYDKYWSSIDVSARAGEVNAPLLQIAGWYDNFLRGHLDLWRALRGDQHRIVVGPWDHEAYLSLGLSRAGERDFGPMAIGGPTLVAEMAFQWFDHWLYDKDTPFMSQAPIRYYVMGRNEWVDASAWPPQSTPTDFYLGSGGRANSRLGDGLLSSSPSGAAADGYRYDPDDPVLSVGGRTLHPNFVPGGVQDQRSVEERDDVLVYTSQLLTSPVEIAGTVTATIFASSSAPDTDFTAKLVDVEPEGYCANIAEGIVRARYRNGTSEELIEPGEVYEFHIDLWDVAYVFPIGHRIRLEISSSNWPRFSRNLNAAIRPELGSQQDMQVAIQQVWHDAERPSRVTLPMIE